MLLINIFRDTDSLYENKNFHYFRFIKLFWAFQLCCDFKCILNFNCVLLCSLDELLSTPRLLNVFIVGAVGED